MLCPAPFRDTMTQNIYNKKKNHILQVDTDEDITNQTK